MSRPECLRQFRLLFVVSILALSLMGCTEPPEPARDAAQIALGPGVSLALARRRAATIADLRYDVRLAVPESRSEPVTGRIAASFVLAEPGPVVLDFAQPADQVLEVWLDGAPVDHEARDEHLIVPGVTAGPTTIEVVFTAGDGSLNRQDDFLYTLFVPDRARVAMPIFDQPDLKARYRLQLEVPADWRAVANGAAVSTTIDGGRTTVVFAETPPISSYVFAFAAGRFEVEEAEREGRRMAMYHRETERARVERNAAAIFDLHAAALAWLEEYTGIPYPFPKFDFVLIPSFQYGGMEHPGAILYRAEGLLLEESATQNAHLGRASLIAHETAHMWFGDLVTMEWFTDVWMKETLANFMAAKIVNPSFPEVDHDLRFLLAHYPAAYAVDRTAGANPIRQPLDNLAEAGTLYGSIIYQKAPIVVQQLERLLGERALRDGLRAYLAADAYGNASWSDLIAVLDPLTDEDLAAWSRVWVEEPGRPRIQVDVETEGETIGRVTLAQRDPTGDGRTWSQRMDLAIGLGDGRRQHFEVHLRESRASVREAVGLPLPAYVLPNGRGVGYGLMALDRGSRDYLLADLPAIDDPLTRAVAWMALWDGVLEAEVPPAAFIDLAARALPEETDEQNVALVLGYLSTAYWRHLAPADRSAVAERLETLLWRGVEAADRRSLRAVYFGAYRDLALTAAALARLERVWREAEDVPGLPLAERDYTALARALAVRGVPAADEILRVQRDRIDNPDRRAEFEFVMPALAGDGATRAAFFATLADPDRRRRESWVLSALGWLHHPLRAREAEPHIRPALDLLEEIQRTGDIFFPERWVHATVDGHQTASADAAVQAFLAERPDLAPRLRAKVLQAADGLARAVRILSAHGGPA